MPSPGPRAVSLRLLCKTNGSSNNLPCCPLDGHQFHNAVYWRTGGITELNWHGLVFGVNCLLGKQ